MKPIREHIDKNSIVINEQDHKMTIEPTSKDKIRLIKQNRFVWQGIGELRERKPIEWLISRHLISKGVMFMYGASQAGKTFLAVDMALSLALKDEWLGMAIKRNTPVRYTAFEDYSGVAMRVDGWLTYYGYSESDVGDKFLLGGEGSSLIITKEESVENFIRELGDFKRGIIFIDTLNKVGGGEDENSNGRMGLAISHAERIAYATDSLVIIVHHTGKDTSKGMRGATATHGGADLIYRVDRDDEDREVTFEKIKNGRDGHGKSYRLESVILDKDRYGEDDNETAIAVFKGESIQRLKTKSITGGNKKRVFRLIKQYLTPHLNHEDDYEMVVNYVAREWVEKHKKQNGEKNDQLSFEVKRTITALADQERVIGIGSRNGRDSRIWLIDNEGIKVTY